jgi:hypothetical protein
MKMSRVTGQLGMLLCLAGFVVMFLGWNGAASYTALVLQFPYLISGGILGLSLVVIGAALLVVQNQRTDRMRLQGAIERLTAAVERQHSGAAVRDQLDVDDYVVAGTESYHRLECELPEASDEARLIRLDEAVTRKLSPCRVCGPPQAWRAEAVPDETADEVTTELATEAADEAADTASTKT